MTSLSFLIHVQGRLHLSPNLLEQDGRSWSPTVDPTMIRFNRPCCPEMQNVKFLELHHFGPWLELALEMFFTLTPALALPTSMSPTSGRLPCRQFNMQMMEVKGFFCALWMWIYSVWELPLHSLLEDPAIHKFHPDTRVQLVELSGKIVKAETFTYLCNLHTSSHSNLLLLIMMVNIWHVLICEQLCLDMVIASSSPFHLCSW